MGNIEYYSKWGEFMNIIWLNKIVKLKEYIVHPEELRRHSGCRFRVISDNVFESLGIDPLHFHILTVFDLTHKKIIEGVNDHLVVCEENKH